MSDTFQWMINKQILEVLNAITMYGATNEPADRECAKLESMLEEGPETEDE